MAVYDTTDLQATRAGLGEVKTHLDNMLVLGHNSGVSTVQNTSSTSFVNLYATNLAGIETTDRIFIWSFTSISCAAAAERAQVRCFIGANNSGEAYFTEHTASTLGRTTTLPNVMQATGLSGTVSVGIGWRLQSGTGPIYSDRHYIVAQVLRDGGSL